VVLHVYGIPPLPDAMGIGVGVDIVGPIERAAERELETLSTRHRARPGWGGALLRMGDPRDMILQQAAQTRADMIVMGTHGRRGFEHLVLGSVAESVTRYATCPVLVVPAAKVAG
jgi:nucleotide-binding universal stress UspA family protein